MNMKDVIKVMNKLEEMMGDGAQLAIHAGLLHRISKELDISQSDLKHALAFIFTQPMDDYQMEVRYYTYWQGQEVDVYIEDLIDANENGGLYSPNEGRSRYDSDDFSLHPLYKINRMR